LVFVHITKKDISEGGNVEEVEDVVVLLDVDVKGFILEPLIGEYCDGGEEAVRPGVKGFSQK
jgi:5S rRNA maturation endonuclease (ribonuclease M5)